MGNFGSHTSTKDTPVPQDEIDRAKFRTRTLPFDPRSPTSGVSRTPIQVMEVAKSKNRMLMEIQPRSPSLEVEWTPVDRPTKTPGGSGNMNEQFLKNAKPKNLELPDENTSGQFLLNALDDENTPP